MADDNMFRLALAVTIGIFVPFGVTYRFRSVTAEPLDRWQEGVFILFGLRLGGIPAGLGTAAWMMDPRWMDWSAVPFPEWVRWIGIGLVFCWGLLLVWTFHHLGKNLTDTVVTRKEHTMVSTGPYRFVRHPFYVSAVFAVVGGSLATANWFLFVGGCVPLAFLIVRTRIEEEKLVERFGDDYRTYMRTIGRFWPRLRK